MAQYVGADAKARLAALDQVARETGYSKVQIVYYWLMHQDPAAIPLVTTTNMAQFEEAMGTLKIQLSKGTAGLPFRGWRRQSGRSNEVSGWDGARVRTYLNEDVCPKKRSSHAAENGTSKSGSIDKIATCAGK